MAGFGSGFLNGLNQGASLGMAYNRADRQYKQDQLDDEITAIRKQGLAEASGARNAAVNGLISNDGVTPTASGNQAAAASPETAPVEGGAAQPIAVADPTGQSVARPIDTAAGGPTVEQARSAAGEKGMGTYTVGKKVFTDEKAARGEAESKAPSTIDLFAKNAVSKIQEAYLAQGRVEDAEKWGKWAEDKKGQGAIKEWAGAWTAAQAGDYDTAAAKFGKYYTDHVNDGVDYLGHRTITDASGTTTGFAIQLKNNTTGKETEMQLTPESMIQMGAANNPQTLFSNEQARQKTAETAKVKLAEESRKAGTASALQKQKDDADMQRTVVKNAADAEKEVSKIRTQLKTKIDMLKESGMTDEEIKREVPRLIIGDAFKKGASPEEMGRLAYSDRMKNDPGFARKPEADRKKLIEEDVRIATSAAAVGAPRPTAGSTPAASPAAGGIPASPNAGKRPFYDTKTGQTVYR